MANSGEQGKADFGTTPEALAHHQRWLDNHGQRPNPEECATCEALVAASSTSDDEVCEHNVITGTWRDGEEIARRCSECGVPLDEDGDPIAETDAPSTSRSCKEG